MISINSIYKSYGKKQVLKGASFEGEAGECIAIVGLNGSGKSTLLSILAGVNKCQSGTVNVNGKDLLRFPGQISENIGYVPQENPVIPDLSVKDNLILWYCNSRISYEFAVNSGVIKTLGLVPYLNVKASNLSGGLKKRLSIAMAVANDPPILIMDEPGASLDLEGRLSVRDYLLQFLKRKGTVILATHDEEELNICNKIYVMRGGLLHEVPKTLRGDNLLNSLKE